MPKLRELNAYGLTLTVSQIAEAVGKSKKTVYASLFNTYGGDAVAYLQKHGINDTVELANRLSGARKAEDEDRETAAAVDEIMSIITDGAEESETDEEKKVIKEIMTGEKVPEDLPEIEIEEEERKYVPRKEVPEVDFETAEQVQKLRAFNAIIDKIDSFVDLYGEEISTCCREDLKKARDGVGILRDAFYGKYVDWELVARRMMG